jgi:membrane-bound lytic murein transglycosylase B
MKTIIMIAIFVCSITNAETYKAIENNLTKEFIEDFSTESDYTRDELENIFSKVAIKEKVKKESKNQAEFKLQWSDYEDRVVSTTRVIAGKVFHQLHKSDLERAYDKYGVDPYIITAILGIESNYGTTKGNHKAIDSLSTMAFEFHKRSSFYRKQLKSLLNRCKKENINCFDINSSWAGAIGSPQFIPTSIDAYAVDFNGNGIIDLNNEIEDAIGSIAYYLKKNGWKKDDFIAKRVTTINDKYKDSLTSNLSLNKTVEDLRLLNIKDIGNIRGTKKVKLFKLNDKGKNHVWIGYNNFKSITHYNRSNFYAVAVYKLSLEIR